MDSDGSDFGVESYGISVTTLEEVCEALGMFSILLPCKYRELLDSSRKRSFFPMSSTKLPRDHSAEKKKWKILGTATLPVAN
jgi:hypothetical protein